MWINFLTVAALIISLLLPPTACNTCTRAELACDGHCATPCDGLIECLNNVDETRELCINANCASEEEEPPGSIDGISISTLFGEVTSKTQALFKCNYGGCINNIFICNGQPDCWDGSDETRELCSSRKCSRRKFRCDFGGCIGRLWKCNGLINCIDGSDETLATCRSNTCSSSKFRCDYGGCISKKKKCDGVKDCHDGSDETKELCGVNHTVATTPATTPITQPTPPAVTQPLPTPSQDIIIPEGPAPLIDSCSGLCPCPHPYTHFCVPCSRLESCTRIDEVGVCSIEAAAGEPDLRITVDILACGTQPVINIAGLVRQHGDSTCGSGKKVPVLSIVTADCWGTRTLMQCQADAKWHPYGGLHTIALPATHLCQPQAINSPVCGYRPRYAKQTGYYIIQRKPQWPWLVGLMRNGKYSCAATIISPHFLLTAAHCLTRTKVSADLEDVRNLRVQRLNHKGHVFSDYISNVYVSPGYKGGNTPSDDLALVRVENEIIFSAEVFPACVLHEAFPQDKIAATFNRTKNNYEWDLIMQLHDTRCYSPSDRCSSDLIIGVDKFCGIDKESRRFLPPGSSGGPYLVNMGNDAHERWTVAGVVSSSRSEGDFCPHPYTIFTNVRNFWKWVADCIHNGQCG